MVHHPRAIVQRELVDMMDIDRHRISRVVKDMVALGWLQMQPNPESKRENLLSITAEGKSCLISSLSVRECIGTRL